ncbi:MAG: glycyl-radical enzyme activating protein [candidate division WOR-3 bacterium]
MSNKEVFGRIASLEELKHVRGVVFHIVHGSFVDGYGIRTTVFLKGCPLRCKWCCNPEGQMPYRELRFKRDLCNGCGRFLMRCPYGAITMDDLEGKIEVNRSLCSNCLLCTEACFNGALGIFGEIMTAGEVFEIAKRDLSFYRKSGGGVTIGGGEPTFQPVFSLALIRLCHSEGISVAVDTCGYATGPLRFAVLEEADLILFDLKGIDREKHKRNTGVFNDVILTNLRTLDKLNKTLIIRIPLIPRHNYDSDELKKAAVLLSSLANVKRVDLLPYHRYGISKYRELGRPYPLKEDESLSPQQVYAVAEMFIKYGLKVQIGG